MFNHTQTCKFVLTLCAISSAFICTHTQAADLNSLQALAQTEFRNLSDDLGAVLGYKPLTPATPLGITGFDVGFAVTGTSLGNSDVWKKAASNASIPATVPVPTLRLLKGLPFDIDVGLMYAKVPSANLQLVGGELRWAPLAGGVATPAVAVRLHTSQLNGVDKLSFRTTGVDLSISKGFVGFTPYGGIGIQRVSSSADIAQLKSETFNQNKVFAGVNWNLGLVNLAVEADRTGSSTSAGFKIGFRF
jgi:hypothetical protein